MSRPYRVHELLNRAELDELERFTREPASTIDKCVEWLEARGFVVNRSAVARWKSTFDATERFSVSRDLARTVLDLNKNSDVLSISEAAAVQLSQAVFEQTAALQDAGTMNPTELRRIASSFRQVVSGKRLLQDVAERQKQALDAAGKLARKGGSGADVIAKVRQMLGIAGDETDAEGAAPAS